MIVTLCGSTKFKPYFEAIAADFTLQGAIVLMPNVFVHAGDEVTEDEKILLDNVHKQKIMMSDMVFVINVEGYIGDSTRSEIVWARLNNKPIQYLVPPEETKEDESTSPKEEEATEETAE